MHLEDLIDNDKIQRGVSPDLKEAFLVTKQVASEYQLETNKLKNVLTGGAQVKRYFINYHSDILLIYTTRNDNFKEVPNICTYIEKYKDKITCKEVKQNKHPLYSLHRPRAENIFTKKQKFIGVITGDKIIVALDDKQTYATDGLYLFGVKDGINSKYLMGILNSRLFVFTYRLFSLERGRVLPQVKPTVLSKLPIHKIDFNNQEEKNYHNKIAEFVDKIISLSYEIEKAKIPQTQDILKRQIKATEQEIDKLVYKLYGLNEKEIQIIETRI